MNALSKIASAVKGLIAAGSSYSLTDPNFGSLLARLMGTSTHVGKAVNVQNSMEVTTFWSCVRVLSETTGGLPVQVYEKQKNGNLVAIDHDLQTILSESPNAENTKVEFWETLTANLAQQGNTFAFKDVRADGSVFALTPMPSSLTTVGFNRDTGRKEFDYNDRGKWVTLPAEKVWHVKGFGTNGLVGLSPLVYGRQALGLSLATEEFQAKFFANGASPSLIVSVPQWLNPTQRQQARENLEKLWGGMDNAHKARLLEGGMTAAPSTMLLREAQFMELRGLSIAEICRLMRVPPHMVMDLSRSTNNNIEQQSLEFVMFSLMPYTTRFESSISKWLFKAEERSRFVARFNLDGLLRADAAARSSLLSQLVGSGVLSRNEVRAIEGRNRSDAPGMDDYTTQMQYVPVGMLAELAQKATIKPAMPPPPKELTFVINNETPAHKTTLLNVLRENNSHIKILPAEVNTTVHSPVNVQESPAPDMSGMADALKTIADAFDALRMAHGEDTKVRKAILDRVNDIGEPQ